MSAIYNTQSGTLIILPLAGISQENLSITVENNLLKIAAESKSDERKFLLKERSEDSYAHTFRLKGGIDLDVIEAKLKEGLLTIHIPNQKTHKKIEILAA